MTATVEISARESEVLTLLGEHLSNAEIATKLYISVRTVESHVSSLLRKLNVADRRALAQRAAKTRKPDEKALPAPLTSFVGREPERAALAGMLKAHRQVTATGPGGVGKTRLALAVAAETAAGYPDGVWFADLVPVTDPRACAAAVAGALGVGEQPGQSLDESVLAALADRHALLVLDNCEHVRDGVVPFLERLLAACPRVTVLATSQARLMVPFERVYPVPPLSLAGDSESDAVALFLDRAAAAGQPPPPALREHIAGICRRLDGVALAIELAAARYATLGIDGLTAGLADPLRVLAGGPRADERHRSVRAVLDWSHALLAPGDQALLRRLSVFVSPFTAEAAAQVTGSDLIEVADGLSRLAEHSLLAVTATGTAVEYRALESIRRYGTERLAEAGELDDARAGHLRWCLALEVTAEQPDFRAVFDRVADDLRAALTWATEQKAGERQAAERKDAHRLAHRLAGLSFARTLAGEAQQRYEQAAALADDPATVARMLREAAAAAGCRMRGDDMYRLYLAAAEAAREAGDPAGAAVNLATAATSAYRFSGKFERLPSHDEAVALIDTARELAGNDPAALAAVALAEAGVLTDAFGSAQGPEENDVTATVARSEHAVALAARTGDPIAQSAALGALTGAQSWAGDSFATAATARRRITLLASAPRTPTGTHELLDALGDATEAVLGVGDLANARQWARQLADHPLLAEVGHRATNWLLMTGALAGDADLVRGVGIRFRDAWERAGRPARAHLGPAVAGVAMIHGLEGDAAARGEWLAILDQLGTSPGRTLSYGAVFDAMLLLHEDRAAEAMARLAPEPDDVWKWVTWIWLHWYVALRAEATVLAHSPAAADRLAEARTIVAGNPVCEAIVERAAALLDGDTDRVLATAAPFEAAGCAYQADRSRRLGAR
ncbi:LuxR C-terminal-related transcriptional regulator [Actinoplanes sp. NPDC051861]|uniref:LuxR C-terminal-related transcriptional regulator n=1 Tax=Actinoplanes sp. NPDC051861 TaxID=3155170 RepID=UPI00344A1683